MNEQYTTLQGILLLVGIPLLIIAVIALLTLVPSWTRAGRYRAGDDWNFAPFVVGSKGNRELAALGSGGTNEISSTSESKPEDSAVATGYGEGGISVKW